MKREDTRKDKYEPVKGRFNKVFDGRGRQVRGLWERNGNYYAQVQVRNWVGRVHLDRDKPEQALTVPQAVEKLQDLKAGIRAGTFTSPSRRKKLEQGSGGKVGQGWKIGQQGSPDSPVEDAIAGYVHDRNLHKRKDAGTMRHENSSFNRWKEYSRFKAQEKAAVTADEKTAQKSKQNGKTGMSDTPKEPASKVEDAKEPPQDPEASKPGEASTNGSPEESILLKEIDGKLLKDFTSWRMEAAEDEGKELSGRSVNLNVLALKHVLDWAVVDRWLPEFPRGWVWTDLPEKPKDVRLIEPWELDFLATATMLDTDALKLIDPRVRHLRQAQMLSGQAFQDYVYLLAYSGGRERETIAKRWSHSKSGRKVLHFPGKLAKAGGGKPADDRDVDFHSKLEALLTAMLKRRDPSTDYMFPGGDGGHVGSFRKQWEKARAKLKARHIADGKSEQEAAELCDDLGFHHLRHYFISHAVMAGIDFMTIAIWVSHRDGGVLIGKKYGHLRPGHSQNMARKLDKAF